MTRKCVCCKTKKAHDRNGFYCKNCWDYLMPDKNNEGIGWGNIWAMICHYHAIADKKDPHYEFVNQIITGCYVYEGRT